MSEGTAPLDLQDREPPPLQSLFSFVARLYQGMGFSHAVQAFKLIDSGFSHARKSGVSLMLPDENLGIPTTQRRRREIIEPTLKASVSEAVKGG